MSDKKTVIKIGGGGLAIPLLCVFVVLKLTHQVDWSWLWVLAPLWAPFAIVIAFVAGVFAVVGLGMALTFVAALIEARR